MSLLICTPTSAHIHMYRHICRPVRCSFMYSCPKPTKTQAADGKGVFTRLRIYSTKMDEERGLPTLMTASQATVSRSLQAC